MEYYGENIAGHGYIHGKISIYYGYYYFRITIDCHNNTWVAVRSVNPNDATGNKDILYARFYLEG